ncbi:unnamed protein product [Didymodactylos carnosus]|uniref:Methyltransferase type 11 domain-containing protein n=1 Tax=Didymodactylos carnosus TaxID=1234261 RepID=A0A814HQ35_9BILA|nr:unnamed protein product [Didymodactylos carnosus]CAF1012660.1 unnamed protein product [Didymodactylos carnosus]CAF3521732.1 unnamed protein product [Didymodactylos carnosus]CAF3784025.1 unnamed protein product [Didymodactylos carnosus]
MTSYLGPESPRPYSVAAEFYFNSLQHLPSIYSTTKDIQQYRPTTSTSHFGSTYENEFCFYIAKHAELNCNDNICCITDECAWPEIIQERLFIIKKITHINSNVLQNEETIELLTSNTFDRIILIHCLHSLNDLTTHFPAIRQSLKPNGRLLIIHRDLAINTLPLPNEVLTTWLNNTNFHATKLIEDLQRNKGMSLLWEIETIRFLSHKIKWFTLLYNRSFYPLNMSTMKQITDGLRQLNESYFKYQNGPLELYDRLLFLSLQVESVKTPPITQLLPSIKKKLPKITVAAAILEPHETWDYKLLVTDEVTELLNIRKQKWIKPRNLFESSISFS